MKAEKPRKTSSGSIHQLSLRAVWPKPPSRSGTSIEDMYQERSHVCFRVGSKVDSKRQRVALQNSVVAQQFQPHAKIQSVLENFAEPERAAGWGRIGAALTRRRALIITPFAFAGIYALASRKGKTDGNTPGAMAEEVDIVQFDDAGQRLGLARVKRVVKSDSEWRKMLTSEQYYVTRGE